MKYIFDFDGVLFSASHEFKEHLFSIFEKAGAPHGKVEEYLIKERWNLFSLKKMITSFNLNEETYEKIMKKCKYLVNETLLELIKKLGKENCYIVSYGDYEFQKDKIKRSGISPFFSDIIIVSESKKNSIEKICTKYKTEEVIFIDDKTNHFEDLNLKKCPNLKTILYVGQDMKDLLSNLS